MKQQPQFCATEAGLISRLGDAIRLLLHHAILGCEWWEKWHKRQANDHYASLDLDYLEAMGQADRPTASITWSDATLVNRMYEVRRGEYLWQALQKSLLNRAEFLDTFSMREFVRRSVCWSVSHTQVEFLKNGLNLNKIASCTWNYAIWNTIQRQVRGQIARTHLLSELCSTCLSIRLFYRSLP